MSNEEILSEAIKKARRNGWKQDYKVTYTLKPRKENEPMVTAVSIPDANTFIYDHDFAKALWGAETLSPNYGDMEMLSEPEFAWEHHLQQMVISEDPVKYLEDNMPD